jgi:ABC-2 type transport system ATP-binding protein
MPADGSWAVELDGFAKIYRSGWTARPVAAVRGVSLRLAPGRVLGLLGPNGSGKSTILRALAGLVTPTAGRCRVLGQPAGSDEARVLVGYLPETMRIAAHLTGVEFLRYCAGLSSMPAAHVDGRIRDVLGWAGLAAEGGRRLGTYSKGMMQRLGLAQAVLHEPQVLLLDEPTSGLDPEGRLALAKLIRQQVAMGRTVVLASHFLAQAEDICDCLAILGRGRLLAFGPTQELLGTAVQPAPVPSALEKLYLEKLNASG